MDDLILKLKELLEKEKVVWTGHRDCYDDNGNYYEEGIKVGRIEMLEELIGLIPKKDKVYIVQTGADWHELKAEKVFAKEGDAEKYKKEVESVVVRASIIDFEVD